MYKNINCERSCSVVSGSKQGLVLAMFWLEWNVGITIGIQ